jgi:hypothetical protein
MFMIIQGANFMHARHAVLFASVLSVFALTACQSGKPASGSPGQTATGSSPGRAPIAAYTATQPTGPQPTGSLHAKLALVGHPEMTADGRNLLVRIAVTNDRTQAFGFASGRYGVNLAPTASM